VRVDSLAIDLRPRSMMEATDLGVRLVQSRAASVWRSFGPVYAVVAVIALASIEIAAWLGPMIIFWLKPWLDRTLLFVMSRAVFGEETRFADVWHAQRSVWWGQLVRTLTLRRLSPWRSFTQPAYQLEGQRGSALRKRAAQLLKAKRGAGLLMHVGFVLIKAIFAFTVVLLVAWFDPQWFSGGSIADIFFKGESTTSALASTLVYAMVVLVVEPFYVAAGFAMYLNRRVELEAWDVEQEFRRAFSG
jgi:hypothetical protein